MNVLDGVVKDKGRIETSVSIFKFTNDLQNGHQVDVGILPDDLLLARRSKNDDGTDVLNCSVALTELLGAGTIIHLGIFNGPNIKAVVAHKECKMLKVGDNVRISAES